MALRVDRHRLQVAKELAAFIEDEALPGTGVTPEAFWEGFSRLAHDLAPKNRALLDTRAVLQGKIDQWHKARRNQPHDHEAYKAFLTEIGYLVPVGPDFEITTENTDPEIATVPGPQLVVPITNARYALNAANARWGSLYDALYGTDATDGAPPSGPYDRGRGARVVAKARVFLDEAFPLEGTSHADARRYRVKNGALLVDDLPLKDPSKFVGYRGHPNAPEAVLLVNNALHVELVFDRTHRIGGRDQAGLADVRLEAAVSAIMDCEDSVACVDAEDKVLAYRNWLGLMKGDLTDTFAKGGKQITRALNPDPEFIGPDGNPFTVKGRALMLVRDVGHLMTNPAILLEDGSEIFEGLMDAMITVLIAKHDLAKTEGNRNSHTGSVYVVKRKTKPSPPSKRRSGCHRIPSRSESWTRSAGPRSTSRNAYAPPSREWPSSTRASSIAPATKSTPRWKPGPSAARTGSSGKAGSLPTRTSTSMLALPAGFRARPRSARACGPCPT